MNSSESRGTPAAERQPWKAVAVLVAVPWTQYGIFYGDMNREWEVISDWRRVIFISEYRDHVIEQQPDLALVYRRINYNIAKEVGRSLSKRDPDAAQLFKNHRGSVQAVFNAMEDDSEGDLEPLE